MTWTRRCFDFMVNAPREVSAKDLEVSYSVPHPRRVLGELGQQGCIEEAFRKGKEKFWRVRPGASPPVDRRETHAKRIQPMGVRARQLKLRGR